MKNKQRIAAVLMTVALASLSVAAPAARCWAEGSGEVALPISGPRLASSSERLEDRRIGRRRIVVGTVFLGAAAGALGAWGIARALADDCLTRGLHGTCLYAEEVAPAAKIGLGLAGGVVGALGLGLVIDGYRLRRTPLKTARVSFGPVGVLLRGGF